MVEKREIVGAVVIFFVVILVVWMMWPENLARLDRRPFGQRRIDVDIVPDTLPVKICTGAAGEDCIGPGPQ